MNALNEACGSQRWAALMAAAGPYASVSERLAASQRAFDALRRDDWLEAFGAHAEIGAPWRGDDAGAREQAGMAGADDALRAELGVLRADYRERFGFVYLIRARGRTADELLGALRARLHNDPDTEFAIACQQQREITALRLDELAL